ncbi:MAG: hypothetical protein OEX22_11340 [Cyclobacteriaceae bacterium]|nr:hypothetical protein [Cyclobacteriaceae bacterium]
MKKISIITFAVVAILATSFAMLSANKTTSKKGELVVERSTNTTMSAFAIEDRDSF